MSTNKLLKVVLLYIIIANLLGLFVFITEKIYQAIPPNVNKYRTVVLNAMAGDPRRFNNFKTTDNYKKLINTTSVDSVEFYFDIYKHTE